MKRISLIMVALLIGHGAAYAGELKVMVPVDDFKQMSARIEALEQENSQLKRAVNTAAEGTPAAQDISALQARLESLEQENNLLKQQAQPQEAGGLAARISALEQENDQLQKQLAALPSQPQPGAADPRLAELESENSQLKQQVNTLKEGSATAAMIGDKSTARHLYANARHVSSFHHFKF